VGPLFYLLAAVVVVLDQITKLQIAGTMLRGESRQIIGDFFRLTYVHNDGAAFGLSLGGRWSFIAVTVVVIAFIVFFYVRSEKTRTARWALALILGGAVGNLADRLRLGEVVDFLHLSVAGWSWPIFNVADIAVSVGVGLLAIHLFRKERPADDETGIRLETSGSHDSTGSESRPA
jgi:signal peptidase II